MTVFLLLIHLVYFLQSILIIHLPMKTQKIWLLLHYTILPYLRMEFPMAYPNQTIPIIVEHQLYFIPYPNSILLVLHHHISTIMAIQILRQAIPILPIQPILFLLLLLLPMVHSIHHHHSHHHQVFIHNLFYTMLFYICCNFVYRLQC